MPTDPHENDRRQNTNGDTTTGFRDPDGREGFGDDAGTRVGRPDGAAPRQASGAQPAPHDAQGTAQPGQASTNTQPVADGVEGSEVDGEQGGGQSRVQDAARGITPDPPAGNDRPTYNL